LALSSPYFSDHMDYRAQFIIPRIDSGRCVADIYEYVDTDFMMKFFACKQLEQPEPVKEARWMLFCLRPPPAFILASRSIRMASIDISHPSKKQRTEGPKVRAVGSL